MRRSLALGGLEPVDPNSPKIQEVSAWAVNQYNKEQGESLKFVRALDAKKQLVNGMNYYIVLEATSDGLPSPDPYLRNNFSVKVYEQASTDTLELLEFKPLLQENARIAIPN
ncbi:cysteine proteinase inhibitor A [Spinacia oleracea]|uniref:Cysteine proteinase inhibitor n=1 Tax=Spinacia oleracea TaxID=3562 RepID=A0A9R0J9Y9_SPIOL|nr:cysteine proteinase inhibitor A-like [Spinacia oleracea]